MKKVMKMVLEDNPFGRNFVFNKGAGLPLHPPLKVTTDYRSHNLLLNAARESVMKLTGGNYPAPLKIIDVVKAGKISALSLYSYMLFIYIIHIFNAYIHFVLVSLWV